MAMALEAASEVAALTATTVTNEEDDPMVTILPQEVIDALAELDLELSEGRKNSLLCMVCLSLKLTWI